MKIVLCLLLTLPICVIAQHQIYLGLPSDKDHFNTVQTKSKPKTGNPFTKFNYAFISDCQKELGKEILKYKDTTSYYPQHGGDKRKKRYSRWINYSDLLGVSLNGRYYFNEGEVFFTPNEITPIFDIRHWTESVIIRKELFTLPFTERCENGDYTFLIKSYINQDELPDIRDYLCSVYDGGQDVNFFDFNLKKTDLESVKPTMIDIDTSSVYICSGPDFGEHVYITKQEYFFDDLEIAIYNEVNYCSESATFGVEVLYYGVSLPVVDPETGVMKYRKTKFLIPNKK